MSMSVFPVQRIKPLVGWESSVSPEVVARAKELLQTGYPEFHSTANFYGVGEGEEDYASFKDRACHAGIMEIPANCRKVLATENARARRERGEGANEMATKGEARPFLRWFLYDSPYSFIILNKDDFEFCEEYGFVFAGDAPTTLVQSASIISRHFSECTARAFLEFNKLVGRGIDPFIAYQICFNSSISDLRRDTDLSKVSFSGKRNHRVTETLRPQFLVPYYTGENKGELGNTFEKQPSIYGSSTLFTGYGPAGLSSFRRDDHKFHNFLLEREGKLDKSKVYRPPNPFVRSQTKVDEYLFTSQQAVTDVADYVQQAVKEMLGV